MSQDLMTRDESLRAIARFLEEIAEQLDRLNDYLEAIIERPRTLPAIPAANIPERTIPAALRIRP